MELGDKNLSHNNSMSKRRLQLLDDISLLKWLIGVARDRFDPKVTKKPSKQMVDDVILEIFVRMQVNGTTCIHCGKNVRDANFCYECGEPLKVQNEKSEEATD